MVLRSINAQATGPILVVDDEVLIRLNLVALLEDAGLDVLDAANADEALDMLGDHPEVRILLTDVQMPGSMDGIHLAHRVREIWPRVGLMLMSGNLNMPRHTMPDRAAYIGKPFDKGQLMRAIASLAND